MTVETQQYTGHFTWRTQSPPASDGQIRSSQSTWPTAQSLSFGALDNTGLDARDLWQALQVGDLIHLEQTSNSSSAADYSVSSPPVAQATAWNIGVAYAGGSGTAGNNQDCTCTFTLKGTPDEPDVPGEPDEPDEGVGRVCAEFDVAGFVLHQNPTRLFLDASAGANAFPDLYWCQWCHEVFVRTGEELL